MFKNMLDDSDADLDADRFRFSYDILLSAQNRLVL